MGDRYDIIKLSISNNVKLIILTGDTYLPKNLIKQCKERKISVISTELDSYLTAKYINQVNFLSSIMVKKVAKFYDREYLGMVHRGHILNPSKKKVILVDHSQ